MQEVCGENLNKLRKLFREIRFYMGNSVLDGKMGKAFADNSENPNYAFLLVRNYCFMSGQIEKQKLKEIINHYGLKEYKIVPSDSLKEHFEDVVERYSMKKNPKFNIEELERYSNSEYEIVAITNELADKIKKEEFMAISDNYKCDGVGCLSI